MEYPVSQKNAQRSYTDYVLVAPSAPEASAQWSHNLMKLYPAGINKTVDPRSFTQPVHLNRRDDYTIRGQEQRAQSYTPRVVDPKYGAVTVANPNAKDKGKQEEMDYDLVAPAPGKTSAKPAEGEKPKKRNSFFQEKTQQVYQTEASAKARIIAREERNAWLLEDGSSESSKGHQRWVGRVEGGTATLGGLDDGGTGGTSATKGGNYMLFVVDNNASAQSSQSKQMQVLPVHRWYKFVPKPLVKNLDAEEAEREFTKRAKAKVEDRWGVRNKELEEARSRGESVGPSRKGVKGEVKEEDDIAPQRTFSAIHGEGRVANRTGASRLQAARGGNDEDQYDEFDYDEEFQDDEEGAGQYGDDAMDADEAKELEERIKKDQRGAIPGGETEAVEEDVDPDENRQLDSTGKQAKKLLKKLEKKLEYESDDDEERNPYASEVDSSGSETEGGSPASASGTATALKATNAKLSSVPPGMSSKSRITNSRPPSLPSNSRSNSPVPTSNGSAYLAKRATSPRPGSASKPSSRASSPSASNKRKAADDEEEGTAKKAKVVLDDATKEKLSAEMVISFVNKSKPGEANAKTLLKHIKNKVKVDPRVPGVMDHIQSIIRENLTSVGGVYSLLPPS